MGTCVLRNGAVIEDFQTPYIIAEVNSSHNGNLETAKKMIEAAKSAGCSCVKFQSWSSETLYSKSYYENNPIAKRIVKKMSLEKEDLKLLSLFCAERKIDFSSTPYSEEEVDFLVEECNAPFVKIASMELNNNSFLEYIGNKGVPVIISTGMGSMSEITAAIKILEGTGNENISILHCVSSYPAKASDINLNNIYTLRENFPGHPIGFSDHTLGFCVAAAAVALGAAVIEKHLTLDAAKIGMDNQMATEPEAMKQMVEACRDVHEALGGFERVVSDKELDQQKVMRRSIVAARDIQAGSILEKDYLCAKRPGTGIPPDKMYEIIGKRVNRDIEADTLIDKSDIVS